MKLAFKELTRKENIVLAMVAAGLRSREIAQKLNVSKRTIETHRYNIMNKMNTRLTSKLIWLVAQKKFDLDSAKVKDKQLKDEA